ncbi:MAG: translation initiation factor IF-3 [bacterium]|nr:translation initiation factor IF-3 [bacterium]
MQRSRRKQKRAERHQKPLVNYHINEQITAPALFVIDEEGVKLGAMDTAKALSIAQERGYDLVEVFPNADPPVARFGNMGQLQYEAKKKLQKQRVHQKKVDIKGIRLSVRISDHDRDLRLRQAFKFLDVGHKIKLELILRGREHMHKDLARAALDRFVSDLRAMIAAPPEELKNPTVKSVAVEQQVTFQGSKVFAIVMPLTSVASTTDADA